MKTKWKIGILILGVTTVVGFVVYNILQNSKSNKVDSQQVTSQPETKKTRKTLYLEQQCFGRLGQNESDIRMKMGVPSERESGDQNLGMSRLTYKLYGWTEIYDLRVDKVTRVTYIFEIRSERAEGVEEALYNELDWLGFEHISSAMNSNIFKKENKRFQLKESPGSPGMTGIAISYYKDN